MIAALFTAFGCGILLGATAAYAWMQTQPQPADPVARYTVGDACLPAVNLPASVYTLHLRTAQAGEQAELRRRLARPPYLAAQATDPLPARVPSRIERN